MNPARIRVLYAGPPVAGVRTSIEHLARVLRADLRPAFVRRGIETSTNDGIPLEIQTDVRTSYYFPSAKEGLERCSSPSADDNIRVLGPMFLAHLAFLRQLDGIIFVADSQVERREANGACLDRLSNDLREADRDPAAIPLVLECNKRDLPNIMPIETMLAAARWQRREACASVARRGEGILEALHMLLTTIRNGS